MFNMVLMKMLARQSWELVLRAVPGPEPLLLPPALGGLCWLAHRRPQGQGKSPRAVPAAASCAWGLGQVPEEPPQPPAALALRVLLSPQPAAGLTPLDHYWITLHEVGRELGGQKCGNRWV